MKAKHFKSRHALLMSLTSLMLCVSMLFGATFAWFTDSVTSGVNRIISGNLDVELYHTNNETADAKVDGTTKLFNAAADNNGKLWEPGAVAYETFRVANEGSLALKYQLSLVNGGNNTVANTSDSLLDVLRVGIVDGSVAAGTSRDALVNSVGAANWTTLGAFIGDTAKTSGNLDPQGGTTSEKTFTVVLYWPSDTDALSALTAPATDNDYNLNNDKTASDGSKELYVNLGVYLLAGQYEQELDSFDNTYDKTSDYPAITGMVSTASSNAVALAKSGNDTVNSATVSTTATPLGSGSTTVKFTESGVNSALAAETATTDGNTISKTVTLETTTTDVLASSSNYQVLAASDTAGTATPVASIDLTLKVTKTEKDSNDKVVSRSTDKVSDGFIAEVETYIAKGLSYPVTIKYGDNETWTAENENSTASNTTAAYNAQTGKLTFVTSHFSDYVVYSPSAVLNATTNTGYATLKDAFDAVKSGETVVLLKDVETGSEYTITSPLKLTAKSATLDLNGKTITVTNNFSLCMSADNIIVKNGSIESGPNAEKRTNMNSYVLVLGGIEKADKVSGITISGITMKGGVSAGGDSGANVKGVAENVTIKDCNITSGDYYAVCSQNRSSVTIESGTYISNQDKVNAGKGNPPQGVLQGSFKDDDGPEGQIIVIGGTFNGEIKATNKDWISITGGTFNQDPSSYVASGYTAVPNAKIEPTSWTVLSETGALAAKAKAAGLTVVGTGVETDSISGYTDSKGQPLSWDKTGQNYVDAKAANELVYRYYQDGKVYIQSAKDYTGTELTVKDVDGICMRAFSSNTSIETLTIAAELEFGFKAFSGNSTLKSVSFNGATTIPNRLFHKCSALENVELLSGIKKIEELAFCESGIKNITVPATIETIQAQAFAYMKEVKTITVNGNPTVDLYYIGRACTDLETVVFAGDNVNFTTSNKNMSFCNQESSNTNTIKVYLSSEDAINTYKSHCNPSNLDFIVGLPATSN